MLVETSNAIRKARVVQGQFMVTVAKPVVMVQNGRREKLQPGIDRFHRDHRVVRAHPELFTPCDPRDKPTAVRHSARCGRMANAIRAKLGRGRPTRTATPNRRFQLPAHRPTQFRLP